MIEKEEKFEEKVILDPMRPPFRKQEQFKFLYEDRKYWYGEHLDLVRCLINVYDTRHFIKYFYTDILRKYKEHKIDIDCLTNAVDYFTNGIDAYLKCLEKDIINNLKRFKENETIQEEY